MSKKKIKLIKQFKKINIIESLKVSLFLVSVIYVIIFPLILFFYSIIKINDTGLVLMSFFNLIFFVFLLYTISRDEL